VALQRPEPPGKLPRRMAEPTAAADTEPEAVDTVFVDTETVRRAAQRTVLVGIAVVRIAAVGIAAEHTALAGTAAVRTALAGVAVVRTAAEGTAADASMPSAAGRPTCVQMQQQPLSHV